MPTICPVGYMDGPDMSAAELVEYIRERLGRSKKPIRIPKVAALLGGHLLDVVARATNRTFPINAIRVRKFCEGTQFRADRVVQVGFVPSYSLKEDLARTIQSEFLK